MSVVISLSENRSANDDSKYHSVFNLVDLFRADINEIKMKKKTHEKTTEDDFIPEGSQRRA